MFYSTQILAKKGPLGTVWLAAHMDQRLKKNSVFEANIAGSVGMSHSVTYSLAISIAKSNATQFCMLKKVRIAISPQILIRLHRVTTQKECSHLIVVLKTRLLVHHSSSQNQALKLSISRVLAC